MFDNRKLNFDISQLVSCFVNETDENFKILFKSFTEKYYFSSLEKIETELNKNMILIYSKIIETFNIFSGLSSLTDDYENILKVFSTRKAYPEMLKYIYEQKYISHSSLACKLGKSSQALTDFVKKVPKFDLFIRLEEKGTVYTLTKKGTKFYEWYMGGLLDERIRNIEFTFKELNEKVERLIVKKNMLDLKIVDYTEDIKEQPAYPNQIIVSKKGPNYERIF